MSADTPVAAAPGALSSPGSQTALRERNRQRIIAALLNSGPLTQAELSRRTGLSNATVSNLVRIMSDSGLVSTEPTTSSGRRATSVRLNSDGTVAVGIDIGRSHVRVVLASMDYRVVAERSKLLPLGHCAIDGVNAAAALMDGLLEEQGLSRQAALGAGIGIPGPIDRRSGTVVQGAILPEWVGINILELFEQNLQLPVQVDNDANLGALAQVTWGPHSDVSDLAFVKIGTGIGAGLILGGSPYYGNIGVTGEIGHATIVEHGQVCRCGNRGCLETVASTAVMIELLSRAMGATVSIEEILRLAARRDAATLRVIDGAGLAIGQAMATVANLLNPQVFVVGGPLAELGETLMEPIRRSLIRHSVPTVGETTQLLASSLGNRAEALGAAALVLQQHGLGQSAPARRS